MSYMGKEFIRTWSKLSSGGYNRDGLGMWLALYLVVLVGYYSKVQPIFAARPGCRKSLTKKSEKFNCTNDTSKNKAA